jgi:hypothetical protein
MLPHPEGPINARWQTNSRVLRRRTRPRVRGQRRRLAPGILGHEMQRPRRFD